MFTLKNGVSIASTVALAAVAGVAINAPAAAAGKLVHCYGVNSCKGMSDCKSGTHDCKGMNECKGQGFKALTVKACKTEGGSTKAPK